MYVDGERGEETLFLNMMVCMPTGLPIVLTCMYSVTVQCVQFVFVEEKPDKGERRVDQGSNPITFTDWLVSKLLWRILEITKTLLVRSDVTAAFHVQ